MLDESQAEAHTEELLLPRTLKSISLSKNPAGLRRRSYTGTPPFLSHASVFVIVTCN